MNAAEHARVARAYADIGASLIQLMDADMADKTAIAGEALWGAALNALNYVAHKRGMERYPANNNERWDKLDEMIAEGLFTSEDKSDVVRIVRMLHNHFYHRMVRDEDIDSNLIKGRRALIKLLAYGDNEERA